MRRHQPAPARRSAPLLFAVAIAATLTPAAPSLGTSPLAAQAVAGEHEGAAALGIALRRLGTTKRVLMIAAHPDDENTAILSALALRDGADVAYLSLTRGEGGQNLIGPELQEGLGLIRSEELLAARRLDGARQFFTRAYDFGYSRTADETFRHWPRDTVLADAVEVIRRFRPDVIVSVFSGTPRDGHGHHQVAGIIAREAFTAAAEASRFSGRGGPPHRARYLFQAAWRPQGDEPIVLPTGDYDPLLGRSHYQIAMASRSRHRSQDMGQPEPIGPRQSAIVPLAGDYPQGGGSLFVASDTTLGALAARLPDAPARVATAFHAYEQTVARARLEFNPLRATSTAPLLAQATEQLERAEHELSTYLVGAAPSAAADRARFAIEAEKEDVRAALWAAGGLVFDATSDHARVVPGQELTVTVAIWNGGETPVQVRVLEPELPSGWQATAQDPLPGAPLEPGAVVHRRFRVRVPADAQLTEPYYLRAPRQDALYLWPEDPALRGMPFEPPQVRARTTVALGGVSLERRAEVAYVEIDKAVGERRRPVLVVPAVSVVAQPQVAVVPTAASLTENGADAEAATRQIAVELRSEAPQPFSGMVRLETPAGWRAEPASIPVRFERTGETRPVRFTLFPPATLPPGEDTVHAIFEADGRRYDRGYTIVDHPHIRPRTLYRAAATRVAAFPVTVAPNLHVGYIEGAGDDGVVALRQLGVTVDPLDAEALARGDLSRYDAIVLGIRAYETRQDLIAHNDRLLEYARSGGNVVVQYNKYEYVDDPFAPYPLTMARPHGRVTDEAAPVRLLEPEHPLLSWPNRITEADFEGWVQERGLYFADTWAARYTPLLEMADPGLPADAGGLLVARMGQGWYTYTGLALFRQLPEAVPGAYRLLANLVSLGRAAAGR